MVIVFVNGERNLAFNPKIFCPQITWRLLFVYISMQEMELQKFHADMSPLQSRLLELEKGLVGIESLSIVALFYLGLEWLEGEDSSVCFSRIFSSKLLSLWIYK